MRSTQWSWYWLCGPAALVLMVVQWGLFVKGVQQLQQGETVAGAINIVVNTVMGGVNLMTVRFWLAVFKNAFRASSEKNGKGPR